MTKKLSTEAITPEWKRFQDFVASIERLLGPRNSVESPARLKNARTGRTREVDVLIRVAQGRREVKIVFECRRRRGVSDVTWIEQLVGKRDNLGIDRMVAVSEKHFSQAALDYAQSRHIELMQLSEFYSDDWKPWLLMDGFSQTTHHLENCAVGVVFGDQEEIEHVPGVDGDTPVFRNNQGDHLSFLQIWRMSTGSRYQELPRNGPRIRIEQELLTSDDDPIYMEHGDRSRRVKRFHITGDVWVEEDLIPYLPAVTYRDGLSGEVVLGYAETAVPVTLPDGRRCYLGIAKIRVEGVPGGAGPIAIVHRPAE